jgi:hypothetical protein
VAAIWLYPTSTSAPAQAADMFASYKSARLPIDTNVTDPVALERRFASASLGFTARVFDLGMMGFRIVAASATAIGRRPAALWVYRGAGQAELLCIMFAGDLAALPRTQDIRTNNGFTFHVFHERGLTQVFWQEGSVLCVLVSDQPEADVVQLAFAKAMRPNP